MGPGGEPGWGTGSGGPPLPAGRGHTSTGSGVAGVPWVGDTGVPGGCSGAGSWPRGSFSLLAAQALLWPRFCVGWWHCSCCWGARAGCAQGDGEDGLAEAAPSAVSLPAGPQRVRDQPRAALLPHRPPEPRAAVPAVGGRRHLRRPRQHQRESHHRACRERYGGAAGARGRARRHCCPLPRVSLQRGKLAGTAQGVSALATCRGVCTGDLPARLTSPLPPSPCQDHLLRRHRHHPLDEGRAAALQLRRGARPCHQVDQGQVGGCQPCRSPARGPRASPLLRCAWLTRPLLSGQRGLCHPGDGGRPSPDPGQRHAGAARGESGGLGLLHLHRHQHLGLRHHHHQPAGARCWPAVPPQRRVTLLLGRAKDRGVCSVPGALAGPGRSGRARWRFPFRGGTGQGTFSRCV